MIKSKISTKVRGQERVDALMKVLRGHKNAYVSIGFHSDARPYPDGTEVIEVALWNEFGTETAPERSFIRSAIDDNESKINSWREEAVDNILLKGWTVFKALDMLGFRIQLLIQNKIRSNVPPPNADSTVAHKERHWKANAHRTLMASEHMLQSVTYKVVVN